MLLFIKNEIPHEKQKAERYLCALWRTLEHSTARAASVYSNETLSQRKKCLFTGSFSLFNGMLKSSGVALPLCLFIVFPPCLWSLKLHATELLDEHSKRLCNAKLLILSAQLKLRIQLDGIELMKSTELSSIGSYFIPHAYQSKWFLLSRLRLCDIKLYPIKRLVFLPSKKTERGRG